MFGQKGSGESGYLGAPAAIASAVNDAIRPLGIVVNSLPIKIAQLGDMIAAARDEGKEGVEMIIDVHGHLVPPISSPRSAGITAAFRRCA